MRAALVAVLLLLITAGFYWKLVLTDQYTWLESPDLANQVLPWFQFQAGEWHKGTVPLWDPHLWGGQSLIGQAQPGVAYPLNWVLFNLPLRNGWIRHGYLHWYYVLIHFMAVLFCYWLCRDLKRSRTASLLAGISFGLGGYIGTTDWPQMINGAVWAPLVFLFLLRSLDGRRPVASAALAGMFLGIAWLSGHHQIPIYVTLAAGGVWLYHMLRKGWPNWRLARLAAVFLLFTALVGALQILPAYEYGKLSRRWVGTPEPIGWSEKVPYTVHAEYALNPPSILGILIPGLHQHSNPFVGVVVLSLAALALAASLAARPVRLFGMVALAGLLFSLGGSNVLHGVLYAVVPLVDKARSPSMAVFIFQFGLAVLGAFGLDALLARDGSAWPRRLALALAAMAALLLALTTAAFLFQKAPDDRYALTALIALLMAGLLYGCHRGHLTAAGTGVVCVLVLLIELGNVSGATLPHRSEQNRNVYLNKLSEHTDIIDFLKKQPWPARVEVDDREIPWNLGDWQGVDTFGGYVASLPENLWRIGIHDPRTKMLFGVNYTVAPKPTGEGQKEVFRGASGLNVYMNPAALPRVWTVHEVVRARDHDEVHHFRTDPEFDLRRKSFTLGQPPELESCSVEDDRVRLISRESNRLEIEAEMGCAGLVVLGENYFPGWTATVDGRRARIYEAYAVLRGLVVDRGKHRIEMHYRPRSVYLGAVLTALGVFGAATLAWVSRRRRPEA